MFYLSEKSKQRLKGVNPDLIKVIDHALTISKVDFGIPAYGGLRKAEDQNALYRDGKSKADGFKKLSNHQYGDAFDVYAYVDGKASWDECHLAMVAAAILQSASELRIRIRWGGHFTSFIDMPHFELAK